MRDFREYSPEDVILSNLRENTRRADMLREQEVAHLQELAKELLSMGDLHEILASLHEHCPPSEECDDDVLAENKGVLSALHRVASVDRALLLSDALCPLLASQKGLTTEAFFSEAEIREPHVAERIVYPKSTYTDSAYLSLSELLQDPHAAYTHSFISACEEVYNGLCDYCILPLENAAEGLLVGFLKLIVRYGLKIVATCDVEGHGEGKKTRFALLSREIVTQEHISLPSVFALLLPFELSKKLSAVLASADFFGHTLLNVGNVPVTEGYGSDATYLFLRVEKEKLNSFLLYLTMEITGYIPLGIYHNLQKKGKT